MAISLKAVREFLVAYERLVLNAEEVLIRIDAALDGFGVECIRDELNNNNIIAEYVNMGDTYAPTILFSHRTNRFYACSWGDWYEKSPEYKKYEHMYGYVCSSD